jgi:hypothetical protein
MVPIPPTLHHYQAIQQEGLRRPRTLQMLHLPAEIIHYQQATPMIMDPRRRFIGSPLPDLQIKLSLVPPISIQTSHIH